MFGVRKRKRFANAERFFMQSFKKVFEKARLKDIKELNRLYFRSSSGTASAMAL